MGFPILVGEDCGGFQRKRLVFAKTFSELERFRLSHIFFDKNNEEWRERLEIYPLNDGKVCAKALAAS